MKRTPTPAAIRAALAAPSLRKARTWLVQFENGEVQRRYQVPVDAERVPADHHAALAALPMED